MKVESDAQRGVPLGWQEIRSEGEELILPADKPLDLMLMSRSKQHFSVDVFEQSPAGERVPANVTRLEI